MSESDSTKESPAPEREILQRLAFESLREQKRARRWSIFFKAFFALYLLAVLVLFRMDGVAEIKGEHTALVELEGVIKADGNASADAVVSGLRAAFKSKSSKGVLLRVNSPGGSPVQSDYINREIHRLREKYPNKPMYSVVTDIAASGGYYVASAAEKVYANQSSIVGSIGVLMDGFGFVETLKKLGIERRLLTSGKYKGMLDPFSPLKEVEKGHAQLLLEQVHDQFIEAVQRGRGDRLVDNEDLYSGLFWTGLQAKELGLIDEFGSASQIARDIFGAKEIIDYTVKPDFLDRFAEQLGVGIAKVLSATLDLEGAGRTFDLR